MGDISPLDPAEYPSEDEIYALMDRMRQAGLVETEDDRASAITPTPEGFIVIGMTLALILLSHPDRDRLVKLRGRDLERALVAIGVRARNARAEDGQHRG